MIIKHVAQSGLKEGQWVNCHAQQKCRNQSLHVSEKQFYAVQVWLKETKERKNIPDITRYDVVDFLALSKKDQNVWLGKATEYAMNQRGFSHTEGEDPFERNVAGSRSPSSAQNIKNQRFAVAKEQARRDSLEKKEAEQRRVLEQKKLLEKQQAAERAEKRRKAALAREEARKQETARIKLQLQRDAAARREAEWKKNSQFITFENSYSNQDSTNGSGLNKNHVPAQRSFVNTPDSLPETADFSPNDFAQLKNVWSAAGVKANYSHIEEIKYPHRDNVIRVHGLTLTSTDQYALSSQVKKVRESIKPSYSSGVMKVRIQERFYYEYIQRLGDTSKSNKDFKYFASEKKVEKVFLGRDMVEFDLEVYGDQSDADQSLFILSKLPGGKVFSTGTKYQPKKSISFSFNDDEETKTAFGRTQKIVSEAKGKATNLKDNMFLEKAQSEYIPEAVSAYYKVKKHADPNVRAEGKKLFLAQMNIINSHVDNIQNEANNALLNEQRMHLMFLKDKTGEGSSLNLR